MNVPDITGKNVLILGWPSSGKTTFANKLNSGSHRMVCTDDYIRHGYKNAMYMCLADLRESSDLTIVEGVQGYRLLRAGALTGGYLPDLVIELKINKDTLVERYKDKPGGKLHNAEKQAKSLETILKDYKLNNKNNLPEWIVINND